MSGASLVCSCGMTLKMAGARPGRVGKCPKCGQLLRVPDDFGLDVPKPKPITAPAPPPERSNREAFVEGPARAGSAERNQKRVPRNQDHHGPVKPPRKLETWFYESLGYPLWAWSSVALLVFLPPIMTITSSPLPFIYKAMTSDTGFSVPGLVLFLPSMFGGLCVTGYLLIYLSNILTSSCFGEALPPRAPNLHDDDVFRLLGRWFWALFAGLVVGFVPAVAYWIECGEVDWTDRLMLFNLFIIGVAYAQMALLAALLHDDPLAANPITVVRALWKVGTGYLSLSLLAVGWVIGVVGLFMLVQEVNSSFGHLFLTWLFWLAFLYTALVLLRCQGLFSRRHRVVLDWFPDRPRWGK